MRVKVMKSHRDFPKPACFAEKLCRATWFYTLAPDPTRHETRISPFVQFRRIEKAQSNSTVMRGEHERKQCVYHILFILGVVPQSETQLPLCMQLGTHDHRPAKVPRQVRE